MVDLGFIYMMSLKDYLQYEQQKKGTSRAEKQVSKEAGKSRKRRSWKSRKAGKRSKAERQHNG
jgi:hypothetical protein